MLAAVEFTKSLTYHSLMQLTWKASESTSALYAAKCLAERQPVADVRLAEAFAPAVELALGEFLACGMPAGQLLGILTGLAASGVEDNRQLVEQALKKLVGVGVPTGMFVGRMAATVSGLEAAFQKAYRATAAADSPELVDELLVRGRPLLEQWEARGAGMLLQIARLTEEDVVAAGADVVLVYPILGGNGAALRLVNTVMFEAVLTNPIEQLPETVRMAWLLAQLNLDLPKYADHVSASRRDTLGQLALIPPVLAAAEYVELTQFSAETIAQALVAWQLADAEIAEGGAAATAGTLMTWWSTLQEGATPWAVALAALEQMLFPPPAIDLDTPSAGPDDTPPNDPIRPETT